MLQALQINLVRFINKGHERTVKAKKNIVKSVFLKGGSLAISLILMPLTINYVNPTQYGIWLTLSSVIAWAAFFDIGMGNGLKNKLAAAIALGDMSRARSYVTTTYFMLVVISVFMFVAFFFVNPLINWPRILNIQPGAYPNIARLVFMVFSFFCCQFVIQLINTVLMANQEPAKCAVLNIIGQLLMLGAIVVLIKFKQGSLADLIIVMTGAPVLVMAIGSAWYYKGSYRNIAPQLSALNFKYAKDLLLTGSAFFFIQIGALVLYETDNIVITQLFGPSEVTTFNAAFKLFSVILLFFLIIITPFWSAFTEAFVKDDLEWIKASLLNIKKIWMVLSAGTILLLIVSPWIYKAWLGKSVSVPFSLSVSMCIYTIASIWQTIHVHLLNGVGKVKLQLYLVSGSAIVNIPLAILLGKTFGLAGVTMANTILFIVMGGIFWLQGDKIINKTATGIFNA
ncbi:Membrane protein involved in the export of O-antigen and teichoic acid [Mucilaginibacter pineti]|uniref:Membrane protein involved in the export of O-antigen and teichoic acid n=1 Tax=Mucilaginibacter pineti TaxID=1391627 RepID=A0A1G6UF95_9SPHI|nr:oligosaccharide flippase family protein [Mucilaginibacter pineti]SDD39921.1 Membrane protein involved in the export of O-antigen and teichoic acid [Mucilaginibacter pineti]